MAGVEAIPVPSLRRLRQTLHDHPERSGAEETTAKRIADFLEEAGLQVTTGIGGHGVLARIEGPRPRLLRADLDALPEGNGARHACGHDGHMTMLAGAMAELAKRPGPRGVVALFQPAEEDGSGMAACLEDERFAELPIEEAYGIHNVPGYRLGAALVGPGALASTGIRATFQGRPAHAASPHEGLNPYSEMHVAAAAVTDLPKGLGPHALATLIHVRLGQEAYGTSPGEGVVSVTLRGTDDDVAQMRQRWSEAIEPSHVDLSFSDVDPFPETPNDPAAQDQVAAWAKEAGLRVECLDAPFPWSEDFGHAVQRWGGALIGLGAGESHPPLHDARYEFPDDLIDHGVKLWTTIGAAP